MLQRLGLPTVSHTVLHRLGTGEQKTVRRSVRDALAAALGRPFTSNWLGGEAGAELPADANPKGYMSRLAVEIAATTLFSLLGRLGPALDIDETQTLRVAGLLSTRLHELMQLDNWLHVIYGPAAPIPTKEDRASFSSTIALAVRELSEPLLDGSAAPLPDTIERVMRWLREPEVRPPVMFDEAPAEVDRENENRPRWGTMPLRDDDA